ncbi:uncharacterized protein Z519_11187 [Cladophialophora bantiana CBS 173.52]|uniref:CENP-V/GFA domain-containing protein n=1 Tax=Cladophialophora bantiana (strain ATCC 10958 / CBS 173.52 / CDC B-1940 / NIH 8579) TaxID=1442370 RepID=A0A0D2FMZ7_CLAB1|nr:uncharacterized protein Z519_11187 [Cladophialophora bantiana CBS 173.52]KIW88077.1 hypothetical protein Z519_11187 [Cladophialophora bantiana CBS 173.52]
MEGRCQCGQIRFTTPLPAPLELYICHCTECRHQSSSTYGMTAIFPFFDIRQFEPRPGAIAVYARPNSQGRTEGYFCTACGSRLVHVSVSPSDGTPAPMLSVKAGCLSGLTKDMMRTAVHIWTRSAVVDVPEGAVQYEEEPPGGSFQEG